MGEKEQRRTIKAAALHRFDLQIYHPTLTYLRKCLKHEIVVNKAKFVERKWSKSEKDLNPAPISTKPRPQISQ